MVIPFANYRAIPRDVPVIWAEKKPPEDGLLGTFPAGLAKGFLAHEFAQRAFCGAGQVRACWVEILIIKRPAVHARPLKILAIHLFERKNKGNTNGQRDEQKCLGVDHERRAKPETQEPDQRPALNTNQQSGPSQRRKKWGLIQHDFEQFGEKVTSLLDWPPSIFG